MATVTGTATNYLDLVGKLRDFLKTNATLVGLGQQWAQLSGPTSGTPASTDEIVLRGPGLSASDQILVGIRMVFSTGTGYYNVGFQGMSAYNPALPLASQTNSHLATWILLVNTPITYWFIANGRRFIVITRVGSNYDQAYCGFILPEHLPEDWRYPLFIGGSSRSNTLLNSDNSNLHAAFWNGDVSSSTPGPSVTSSAWLCVPSIQFSPVANKNSGSALSDYILTVQYHSNFSTNNFRQSLTGQPILKRIQLASNNVTVGKNFFGCLDGVFHVPAIGVTAEQVVTISSVNYMVIPNVFRSNDGNMTAFAMQ